MRGKNSGPTTTVSTFCFKKKEPSHSNGQIPLLVTINMEELTHVHPILKKFFSKQKIPKCTLTGRIKEFLPAWKLLTKDLGFSGRLPNSSSHGASTGEGSKSTKIKSETTKTSRSGSKGNAGKGLHFKSLSLKRKIFEKFVSDQ